MIVCFGHIVYISFPVIGILWLIDVGLNTMTCWICNTFRLCKTYDVEPGSGNASAVKSYFQRVAQYGGNGIILPFGLRREKIVLDELHVDMSIRHVRVF